MNLFGSARRVPRSPVSQLLGTNNRPTDDQTQLILSEIEELKREFGELAPGMVFQRGLEEQTVPRTARKHLICLNEHIQLLSAVHHLSHDILAEIFLVVVAIEWKNSTAMPRAAIALSHVSALWRTVALSVAQLWCRVGDIPLDDSIFSRNDALLRRLRLTLERAHPCPISFSLDTVGIPDRHHRRLLQPAKRILSLLVQHSPLWQEVELKIHAGIIPAFAGIEGNLPLLQKLDLTYWGDDLPTKLDHFSIAPRLRSVTLHVPSSAVDLRPFLKLPWSQLRRLEEKADASDIGFVPTLRSATGLVSVSCTLRSDLNQITDRPLRSDTVTKLHIAFHHPAGPSTILSSICLPCLKHLTVYCSNTIGSILHDLSILISNSSPPLKSLAILCAQWPDDARLHLTQILTRCDKLSEFTTNYIPLSVLDQLTGTPTAPQCLLPNLKTLTMNLRYWGTPDPHYRSLNALGEARNSPSREHATPELKLYFRSKRPSNFEPLADFAKLNGFPCPSEDQTKLMYEWQDCLERCGRAMLYSSSQSRRGRNDVLRRGSKLLADLEECSLSDFNLQILNIADIPKHLHHIASLGPSIGNDNLFSEFARRCQDLLDKWRPHLLLEARKNRRWGRNGTYSLYYIPENSDMRMNDDKLWQCLLSSAGATLYV